MLNKFLQRSEFTKNILTLFTGSAIAQAVPILISPILTRIFTPEDFGVLALYMSLVSFIAIISSGRYELAVMLPKEKNDAASIVKLSLIIAFAVSVITGLFIIIFRNQIPVWFNNTDIRKWLLLIPFSVFMVAIYQILNYWNTRQKRYKLMAQVRIAQSAGNGVSSVGIGWGVAGPAGLVIGQLIGQLFAAIVLMVKVPLKDWVLILQRKNGDMSEQAKKYRDFPRVNSLHAFTDVLQNSGVIWVISNMFEAAVLGYYSHTFRVMKAPLGLIGSSTAQVFYQQAADKYANGEPIRPMVFKTIKSLALLSAPGFLVIMVFGPQIFSFVFGQEWTEAGEYARLLSPWLFFNFITSPIGHLPLILNKQKQIFYISLLGNALILGCIIFGGVTQDIKTGFLLLSISQVVFLSFVISWYLRISDKAIKN